MNQEWYNEVRKHSVDTDTLESFTRCVKRVYEIHGASLAPVRWVRPMCLEEPIQLEFSTATLYGCIALHNKTWSVNT